MSDPVFERCSRVCDSGSTCERKEDTDVFTGSELISSEMEMPSLPQDVQLGAELTESCERFYKLRETAQEMAAILPFASLNI